MSGNTVSKTGDNPITSSQLAASATQTLILNFAAAVRTAAYYDAANEVMQENCAALVRQLKEHDEGEGNVMIGISSRSLFVNLKRVRTSMSNFERFAYVAKLFDSWQISSFSISVDISEAEMMQLVLILGREHGEGNEALTKLLHERGVIHVEVGKYSNSGSVASNVAVQTYAEVLKINENMRKAMEDGDSANIRQVRHVSQAVVDQVLNDPCTMLALTTIKEFDEKLMAHSANVAILAVFLGQRIGLPKSQLSELCLAAFLHDAGKLEVPSELLNKPGPLDPEEWKVVHMHPILAAQVLLSGRITSPNMRSVVVAYEHHLNYDLSGYPKPKFKKHVSLFGNIVVIADRYDALTTVRPYREANLTPHEALAHLLEQAGTAFDPSLVKLFMEIMGIYPPGTVVGLNTGELAVVCEPPLVGFPLDKPKVRFLSPEKTGIIFDISEQEEGPDMVFITTVINPANMGQMPVLDISLLMNEQ